MGRLVDADLLKEKAVKFSFSTNKWVSDVDIDLMPTVDAVPVVHGYWEDGVCSVCKEEAFSTSWCEPIYDYDWEENLEFSYIERHEEYHLTEFCPNCGAKMDLERSKDV